MLFNSLEFLVFLPIIFILYWFVVNKHLKSQNVFLLACSYLFYSFWDWRFLFLLAFSTLLDYFTGIMIFKAPNLRTKKIWLVLSISINLGFLAVFKYYNFFAESATQVLKKLGFESHFTLINIILPVGISFYTFHGMSYVLDIFYNRIKPTRNFVDYSLFVSFFPLLVAGPIERATHLLPQLQNTRTFRYNQAVDGLKQILWGLFKKVVIADNCAEVVNEVFTNYGSYSGSTLAVGAVLFAFQIYGDFSGYSDIALGTARLFGIELLRNFAYPYFSRDIAEFWRRWHISLSSWFKDYLYIPIGGSKGSIFRQVRNIFIIFIVSGFWHGANWTFIFWGLLNALYIIPLVILKENRSNLDIVAKGQVLPNFRDLLNIILTFGLTVFAWIFFRSPTLVDAFNYVKGIFNGSLFTIPMVVTRFIIVIIPIFLLVEWCGRNEKYAIEKVALRWPRYSRWLVYALIVFSIGMFMQTSETPFIYFQF